MVGQPIQRNPMRLDLEEGAGLLEPPVFIVNAVLNSTLQIVQVVSGDPIAAHRVGGETSARLYGVPVATPADIVITDSHPDPPTPQWADPSAGLPPWGNDVSDLGMR